MQHPTISRITETEKMRIGHAAFMGDFRNINGIKSEILKGRGYVVRTRSMGEDNITVYLKQL
jgi:hypothetical protein